MSFGIVVMAIIIILTLLILIKVFQVGLQHDAHTDIRSAEASRAVQILRQQEAAAERRKLAGGQSGDDEGEQATAEA